MKEKWLDLTLWQKVLFCLQLVLIALFLILYLTVGNQQIWQYQGASLRRTTDGGTVTYTGKVEGQSLSFAVTGTTVEYRRGDKNVTYTVTEDPSAIPAREDFETNSDIMYATLSGVEVHKDGELLFRGAWLPINDTLRLYHENGSSDFGTTSIILSPSGSVLNDPGAATILRLLYAPNVAWRANFTGLACGIVLCVVCMVSLLYADELFRWNLRFRIRNTEDAEPSEWELFSRQLSWVVCTGLAVVIFILGLTGM